MRLAMRHPADVVDIEDVDTGEAEPLQAVLIRPHDPVIGIVVDRVEGQRAAPRVARRAGRARAQQAADLGRQYPLVARHLAHRVADCALGLADTIERCGIDIAQPGAPGRPDDRLGLGAADLGAAAAQGRATQPDDGDLDLGLPDPPPLE
jgi:hypothetical protein